MTHRDASYEKSPARARVWGKFAENASRSDTRHACGVEKANATRFPELAPGLPRGGVLTADGLIAAAVAEVLAERFDALDERLAELAHASPRAALPPPLLDRAAVAELLGVSVRHVDHLRSLGLPELRVGDAPRFEASAVLEWLRAGGPGGPATSSGNQVGESTMPNSPDQTPCDTACDSGGLLPKNSGSRSQRLRVKGGADGAA